MPASASESIALSPSKSKGTMLITGSSFNEIVLSWLENCIETFVILSFTLASKGFWKF